MGRVHYFVFLHQGQWVITSGGQHFGPYGNRETAIRAAIDAAHGAGGDAQVLAQGTDNQFTTEWTCGRDPYPPPERRETFMPSFLDRLRCLLGYHVPVCDFSRWQNAPSGKGFHVGMCKHCGIEMTKAPGDKWRPIAASDRK